MSEADVALSRRRLLAWLAGGATGLLSGCLLPDPLRPICADRPLWSDPGGALTIDLHAHYFNATDLPIRRFVERVALSRDRGEFAKLGRFFGPLLQELGWRVAPTGRRELWALRCLARRLETCSEEKRVSGIRELREPVYARTVRELHEADERAKTRAASQPSAWVQEWSFGRRSLEDLPPTYEEFARRLEKDDRAELHPFQITAESALHFIVEMFQYRYASVLSYLLSVGARGQRRVDLALGALVDYDWWLDGGGCTRTPLREQIELMAEISALSAGRVHAWAPFCPYREAQHRHAPGSTFSSLELVKWAVETQGAVGVKLYPPMGFAPLGNTGRTVWRSAPWLTGLPHECDFGERLDEALRALFAWCEAASVPILAHTNRSNGPLPEFEELAGAEGWARALNEFRSLRVVFGHFGGAGDAANEVPAAEFVSLMGAGSDAPGAAAVADASYFAEVLEDPGGLANLLLKLFGADHDPHGVLPSRLAFGSDWKMVTLEHGSGSYLAKMEQVIDRLAPHLPGGGADFAGAFFGGSAAKVLGLAPGQPARRRLDAFYAARELPVPGWARKLDAGA